MQISLDSQATKDWNLYVKWMLNGYLLAIARDNRIFEDAPFLNPVDL